MTSIEERPTSDASVSRSDADVLLAQVRGIEEWTRDHRASHLLLNPGSSREDRLDFARRREAVERQRQALLEWTARQLRDSPRILHCVSLRRAVIVHRNDWFKGKLAAALEAAGVTVVAALDNGADAVGVVVAEQPDVLLMEHTLPMVSGLDVTLAVRRYAPATAVVVQVGNDWERGAFLDAGAASAYTRAVPPADIAADVGVLLAR
jgi:CheY-like chemotaxis protein